MFHVEVGWRRGKVMGSEEGKAMENEEGKVIGK
jgi:hypothetical protein